MRSEQPIIKEGSAQGATRFEPASTVGSQSQSAARAGNRPGWLRAGAFDPGLSQGTAGIGYQLLRLAHPALVPSVLLWD